MTRQQELLAEECLYMRKYLLGKISELEIVVDTMLPPSPGSVLKMVGRPVAKTPMDTSKTELWGIIRACCIEAEELSAKRELLTAVETAKRHLKIEERAIVYHQYEKEKPAYMVRRDLNLKPRQYNSLRARLLRNVWQHVGRNGYNLDLALQQ